MEMEFWHNLGLLVISVDPILRQEISDKNLIDQENRRLEGLGVQTKEINSYINSPAQRSPLVEPNITQGLAGLHLCFVSQSTASKRGLLEDQRCWRAVC